MILTPLGKWYCETMELDINQLKIDQTLEEIVGINNRMYNSYHTPYGVFNHITGLIRIHHDRSWPDHLDYFSLLDYLIHECKRSSGQKQFEFILQLTTYVHEAKHFHDAYCTPYGVDIFESYIFAYGVLYNLIQEIIGFRQLLFLDTRFPMEYTLFDESVPPPLEMLRNVAQRMFIISQLNMKSDPVVILEGHDRDSDFYSLAIDYNNSTINIPCVHSNVVIDNNPYCILWPINFAMITETLSLLQQESYISSIDVSHTLKLRDLLKNKINPYTPLLIAFTRIFNKRGITKADEGVIYESLSDSLYIRENSMADDTKKEHRLCQCGWKLIDNLTEYFDIVDKNFSWALPYIDVNDFHKETKYEEFPLNYIEYIHNNYLKKSLELIKTDINGIRSFEGYVKHLNILPPPPIIITYENDVSVNDMEFFNFWQQWNLFKSTIDNALKRKIFVCPLRDPQMKHLYPYNYMMPHNTLCSEHRKNFSCGIWKPGSLYNGPVCGWTYHISTLMTPFGGRFYDNKKYQHVKSPWTDPRRDDLV